MTKLQRIVKFLVCIGLITTFLGCAATHQSESTGEYIDDSAITAKVKAAAVRMAFRHGFMKISSIYLELG